MTQDEILIKLESVGIIINIEGSYMLTEKYKILLTQDLNVVKAELIPDRTTTKVEEYEAILNTKTNGRDWPIEVIEASGRAQAACIMDACDIPTMSSDGSYRLRSLNNEAVNAIGNIIASEAIEGASFIAATALYYKNTARPKGFKNFILEGEALDVYNEYITGELEDSYKKPEDGQNQKWR